MAQEKFYVTQEGYNELKRELDHLVQVVRQEVIVELQEARAQGDLSENADYDAARDHQAQVEARIHELEANLKAAEIIQENDGLKASRGSVVHIGSVVTLKDLSDGSENTYTIVGTIEADPFENKISNESPVAQAIMDHKAGETVKIAKAAHPYEIQILDVQ